MLSNPVSVVGSVIAGGGWVFLLFGVGRASGGFGAVYNLHAGSIANNVILLGYVLMIGGLLGKIGEALVAARDSASTMSSAIKSTESEPWLN